MKSQFRVIVACFVGLIAGFSLSHFTVDPRKQTETATEVRGVGRSRNVSPASVVENKKSSDSTISYSRQNKVKLVPGRHFTLITGRLMNEGEFVRKARVLLRPRFPERLKDRKDSYSPAVFDWTDDSGRFLFSVCRGGDYILSLAKVRSPEPYQFFKHLSIANKKNEVLDLGDFDVSHKDFLSGKVFSQTGKPLPLISVIAKVDGEVVLRTLTDARGDYRLGFSKRNKAVRLIFYPQRPFLGQYSVAERLVKPKDSGFVNQTLEEKDPKATGSYVFIYTELGVPKAGLRSGRPRVYAFQEGKLVQSRELVDREGRQVTCLTLKPGRYTASLKLGQSLRIGKTFEVTGEEFKAFQLTEHDLLDSRRLIVELDFGRKPKLTEREDTFSVGVLRPPENGLKRSPDFLFDSDPGIDRIEIEVPYGLPLIVKHKSGAVWIPQGSIGARAQGRLVIKAEP